MTRLLFQAGLPFLETLQDLHSCLDDADEVSRMLAKQMPFWSPGSISFLEIMWSVGLKFLIRLLGQNQIRMVNSSLFQIASLMIPASELNYFSVPLS